MRTKQGTSVVVNTFTSDRFFPARRTQAAASARNILYSISESGVRNMCMYDAPCAAVSKDREKFKVK